MLTWLKTRLFRANANRRPMTRLAAILAGAGHGWLPCFDGDAESLLERVTSPVQESTVLVIVRAIIEWVQALFRIERDVLAGAR